MTADIALIAMTVVALASMGRDYRLQMKIADRVRVVSPPRQQADKSDTGKQPDRESVRRIPA